MKKFCIVTACGAKKANEKTQLWKLYLSGRIKRVYRISRPHPMLILSGGLGLAYSQQVFAPYEAKLTEERIPELLPSVINTLREGQFERVIFYASGSGKVYLKLMTLACKQLGIELVTVGRSGLFMTPFTELEQAIKRSVKN